MSFPGGNIEKEGILMAYPRSGSNWFRYILEFIYCKPTSSWEERLAPRGSESGNAPIFKSCGLPRPQVSGLRASHYAHETRILPHIYHCHNADDPIAGAASFPLILLIRSYKECILRHTAWTPKNRFLLKTKDHWEDYYKSLRFYDKHRAPKLVFYYEDLIDNKKLADILRELNEFLSDDPLYYKERIHQFIKNISVHRAQSLAFYNKVLEVGGSHSDSKSKIFHSRQFKLRKKQEVDAHFESVEPELYEKFLKRYKE